MLKVTPKGKKGSLFYNAMPKHYVKELVINPMHSDLPSTLSAPVPTTATYR